MSRKPPICIGTSATMSNEEGDEKRANAVAAVASRLFGATVNANAVIDESYSEQPIRHSMLRSWGLRWRRPSMPIFRRIRAMPSFDNIR